MRARPPPILAIYEFIDSPDLGTEANPIVIRDDPIPLGLASNPIMIYVDKDCGYDKAEQLSSNADTEIIAIPEFWENLIDKSFPILVNERIDVNSNYPYLDDKATKDRVPKVIEDHSVTLYETEQNKYKDNNCPTQEALYSTTKCIASKLPYGSYGRWSAKRKLLDTDGVSPELRRSKRLTKRVR
ncbi:uncharacterized protein N7518_002771 [Penicillium psychrosexuale]|uniref:uncharacterized protein n=1 Tax=Penicillium psychrosexuale TaxID=1002107 RepID=UPI002545137A|nr:uncharacterized protein N7518_002771 [Penicillium psychrosexuale]KAJ5800703.1 hypothetical protein N7518_002771 [Penicillium psychrosexuale]